MRTIEEYLRMRRFLVNARRALSRYRSRQCMIEDQARGNMMRSRDGPYGGALTSKSAMGAEAHQNMPVAKRK